ncbi:SusD/RagB family nutrient-binding outer membrane lipoprotein [Rhodocytophaga aerolata]|uniref:SusD/RagB family nutrient-binding outer membrane lipoprotein n=1 Tax=Rhodocytophaga aerolata TaxID=455078 RepID=A0ABT8R0V5_9BACT|nr:SusD/RagB family nutrient-binding outer membrane lipoprotein [Rhodocytophaga aerolata]MDO1445301.1 SusD/RagB family nutrient-binding outer membrane lipoprotein [Rhodocytophaga aerolata]
MNRLPSYIKTSFVLVLLTFYSCNLEEANINPNNATDAAVGGLLPVAQANQTWAIGEYTAQTTSILLQQMTGILLNWRSITDYGYFPRFFDEAWNEKFYAGAMKDLHTIIQKANENGATHYRGVAKIQMAMLLGYAVDFWGDVPYSTAFDLERYPQPTFDSGEQVYEQVQLLLDEGIADLQTTSTTSPSTNDLIYRASSEAAWVTTSAPKWIKLARALKARYYNHLSKIDATQSATNALAQITAGTFTSNAEDAKIVFGTTNDQAGPWFGFLQGTFGQNNISVAQEFINLLENRVAPGVDDPRLPYYVTDDIVSNVAQKDADGNYVGTPYGAVAAVANRSRLGPYINTPSSPTNWITYTEVKFIEAEANLRLNNFDAAATAYNEAVKSSILRVTGAANPAYEALYASETAATMQVNGFEKLFTEKYIALFLEAEAWTDWRRSIPAGAPGNTSGIPRLTPAPGNETGGLFPRRFLYPQTELINNAGNVPSASITDRIFWDK